MLLYQAGHLLEIVPEPGLAAFAPQAGAQLFQHHEFEVGASRHGQRQEAEHFGRYGVVVRVAAHFQVGKHAGIFPAAARNMDFPHAVQRV